jgi:hypothetical protein
LLHIRDHFMAADRESGQNGIAMRRSVRSQAHGGEDCRHTEPFRESWEVVFIHLLQAGYVRPLSR